jgi:aspartokinase
MALIVQKFGGTSVGTVERIQAVADAGQMRSPNPLLQALGDLSGLLTGEIWRLNQARQSIPEAVQAVEQQLAN